APPEMQTAAVVVTRGAGAAADRRKRSCMRSNECARNQNAGARNQTTALGLCNPPRSISGRRRHARSAWLALPETSATPHQVKPPRVRARKPLTGRPDAVLVEAPLASVRQRQPSEAGQRSRRRLCATSLRSETL